MRPTKSKWQVVLLMFVVFSRRMCLCRAPFSLIKTPYQFQIYIGHTANTTIAALTDGFYYKIRDEWCWDQIEFHGQVNMPFQASDDSDDRLGEIMFHFKKTRSKPPCTWEKEVHGLTLIPDDLVHYYIYCCWANGTALRTSYKVLNVSYIRKYHILMLPSNDRSLGQQLFRTTDRPRVKLIMLTSIRIRFPW